MCEVSCLLPWSLSLKAAGLFSVRSCLVARGHQLLSHRSLYHPLLVHCLLLAIFVSELALKICGHTHTQTEAVLECARLISAAGRERESSIEKVLMSGSF